MNSSAPATTPEAPDGRALPVELHLAGTYRRLVRASPARVWENVFDWEHLAHLHDGSFGACELLARGAWGWRVRLTLAGREEPQVIELRADRAAGHYASTTLEGTGAGTEIRVVLAQRAAHETDVVVKFWVPEARPERLGPIGAAYAQAYARLWDEDEAMMRARERMLGECRPRGPLEGSVDFGPAEDVRAALPLPFELSGRAFRLVEVNGALLAHSTVCPHWLGPLDDAPVADGAVRCPWHGWRFDVATGACLGREGPSLAEAPEVVVIDGRVLARGPQRTSG